MGETGFFKKSAWIIFSALQALTNCKVSEKKYDYDYENENDYKRTNERTWAKFKVLTN